METTLVKPYSKTVGGLSWVIFILAASFYLYEFCLQVSPGIMTNDMMADLKIDAVGIGVMSSAYFYAYTPMQIPAGLLYDRFGPRILITWAVLICALGAFLFSLTTNVFMASAGRFFMGVGSAFSFIGVLVLVARWFKPSYFAVLAGVAQLMSSIGAITGESLAVPVEYFGWRHTMMYLSIIGVALSALIWSLVRDYPKNYISTKKIEKGSEFIRLRRVLAKPQTWFLGAYNFFIWGPILAFAALWGVPYLMEVYHISKPVASSMVSMVWLGIGISSPLFGLWSDFIGKRVAPLAISAILGLIATLVILYVPNISIPIMYVILFIFGVGAAGQSLSFAAVKENNNKHDVGTASGFNNMATVAGGALFQPLIAFVLRNGWDGTLINNVPVYSVANYQSGLIVLPICYFISLLLCLFFIRETHCYPVEGTE